MAKSAAFARIKAQVLQVTASIPAGKVCTYQSIGAYLDVMPRHVAYILAQLDPATKFAYPWYRVVAGDGTLGVTKRGPDGATQAELLAGEGVQVIGNAVWPDLETYLVPAERLAHGLARQRRPR
jgi:methylated-DNA-protein-cysteine methyltransferase-like protein